MMKKILILFWLLLSFSTFAQDYNFPKEINLVIEYMLKKDYPELFNNNPFQFRPISWQILDIDNDGNTEVFLQTFPHFKQSPTITIFKIDKSDSVIRIVEGLAPGHLIPISKEDDYLDPHTTGLAIDMQPNPNDPKTYRILAESSLKFDMSVILYKNFIHTDKRDGRVVFIDLMYLEDFPTENSCANFQFAKPEQIIAGKVKGYKNNFFIAKVNKELFCYEIIGFKGLNYINKNISIIDVPKDFKLFYIEQGFLKYENKKGQLIDLEL